MPVILAHLSIGSNPSVMFASPDWTTYYQARGLLTIVQDGASLNCTCMCTGSGGNPLAERTFRIRCRDDIAAQVVARELTAHMTHGHMCAPRPTFTATHGLGGLLVTDLESQRT